MTEVLPQDEIDQLLTAINAEDTEPEDFRPAVDSRKIKIYDFHRPDKFSREQLRTMSMIHDAYASLMTTFLSDYFKTLIHVRTASVDQLSYEEFIRSIPCPTTLSAIDLKPLEKAVMEIDPAVTFEMLKLSGIESEIKHELTNPEIKIMKRLIKRSLGCLQKAWERVVRIKPGIKSIETNPQFLQIVPPNDMVILITMECKIGDAAGIINICYPDQSIKSIKDRLTPMYTYAEFPNLIKKKQPEVKMNDVLDNVKIPLRVELGGKDLSVKEIKEMGGRDYYRTG